MSAAVVGDFRTVVSGVEGFGVSLLIGTPLGGSRPYQSLAAGDAEEHISQRPPSQV